MWLVRDVRTLLRDGVDDDAFDCCNGPQRSVGTWKM